MFSKFKKAIITFATVTMVLASANIVHAANYGDLNWLQ